MIDILFIFQSQHYLSSGLTMNKGQFLTFKYIVFGGICSTLVLTSYAQEPDAGDLVDLPFEQLMKMDVVVTSVSKQEEEASKVSSAVFVITEKDIQRSGATSIPEVLNMAPGIQASRISSSEWAVSARGFNGRFSRYLLVLIDGRSIYSSLFNGVSWEEQNLNLHDIERIEVIRGPGGSLWGANAVNGIVNIITRKAESSDKTYVETGGGSVEKGFVNASHSGAIGEEFDYRISYNLTDRKGFEAVEFNTDENDTKSQRISATSNWTKNNSSLNVSGNYYQIDAHTSWPNYTYSEPYFEIIDPNDKKTGGSFQVNWDTTLNTNLQLGLRASTDFTKNSSPVLSNDISTSDFDAELSWQPNNYHSINTGINTRFSSTESKESETFDFTMTPNKRSTDVLSFYFQDKINFSDTLNLTAGVRIDKHSLSESTIQPTLRGFWEFYPNNSIWASYSRAEGTPSLTSINDTRVLAVTQQPSAETYGMPVGIYFVSGESSGSGGDNTQVDAFETGYRFSINDRFSADLAIYYNEYKRLLRLNEIDLNNPDTVLTPTPHLEYIVTVSNSGSGSTHGAELALSWQATDYWHLQYSGTYGNSNLNFTVDESPFSGLDIPRTKHSLRSLLNIGKSWNIDTWITKVAGFSARDNDINSHLNLNLRVAWIASENITISVNAKNLIDNDRIEFSREAYFTDNYIVPRYYFASLEWRLR